MVTIRSAQVEDAPYLWEIYDYYVKNTAISFEYETPTLKAFQERMEKTMESYPYLVIENNGRMVGYAYAGPFASRAAYQWSVETTIYLDYNTKRCGLGRILYEALERALKEMGVLNLYACIAYTENEDEYLTNDSQKFHQALGYTKVGEFHKCGYKFDRWYHMIWMEKIIGEHKNGHAAVKKYKDILNKKTGTM